MEEPEMVVDRLILIEEWLKGVMETANDESLSYGEIVQIDNVYEIIK